MKKSTKLLIVFAVIAAIVALCAFSVSALVKEETYVIIETPEDLVAFAESIADNRKQNAKLAADLDMTGVSYTPPTVGYYGTFDGQGHTISGLTRTEEGVAAGNYGLLFNTLGNGYGEFIFGEVMNLTLKDCSITVSSAGEISVGALTGKCDRNDVYDVTFENVSVTASGTADQKVRAGLVTGLSCWGSTRAGNSTIEYFNIDADSDCAVTAYGQEGAVWAGSLVGSHTSDPVYFHGCKTAATVFAPTGDAGGIIGYQASGNNPKFYDITVNATVSGNRVGAIAGLAAAPDYGLIGIKNNTTLPIYAAKTQEGRLNYFDDTATYGTVPRTDDGKYCISTYDELRWFAKFYAGNNNMNKIRQEATLLLVADLDLTDKAWTPMPNFRGTLDGNNHTISNITVNVENADNDTKHGLLIGVLGNHYDGKVFGVVKNLTVKDSTLTVTGNSVKYNVGGIAGESNRGSFYNCKLENVDISVTGNLNSNTVVGGMAGWAAYAPENPGRDYVQSYFNCHLDKDCSITSDNANVQIGGIMGILGSECANIFDCTVAATLSGAGHVGGIVGNMESGGNRWYTISNCGFFGKILAGNNSGGMIGRAKKSGHILNCTVTGTVVGTNSGKLVGYTEAGTAVYKKGTSYGTLAVSEDKTVSLYAQTRVSAVGHDLRIILLGNVAKLEAIDRLNVVITFYDKEDAEIKTFSGTLGGAESDYQLCLSIKAGNETLTAESGSAIFGNVIKDIPNGAYDYFTVTVSDNLDNVLVSGSTKKAESSLEGKTFYFLGSSVTYGSNSGGKSMADFIAERNNCTVVKEAVSGTTLVDNDSGSYVSRLKNSGYFDKNAKVDHFIVQLSTNDAGQGKTLGTVSNSKNLEDFDTQTVIGAIEYIICYVKETWDCPVTFYTGTNYNSNEYVKMVAALYEIQKKWDIGVIDMFLSAEMNQIPKADYNRYMSDTVHPNALGYEMWWTPVFEKHLMSYEYN